MVEVEYYLGKWFVFLKSSRVNQGVRVENRVMYFLNKLNGIETMLFYGISA